MKIKSINKTTSIISTYNDFIDESLKKEIYNNILCDKPFFIITATDVDKLHFLYRIMFEQNVLKRSGLNLSYYDITKDEYYISISITEAIEFIKQAVPAIFRPRFKELISSIKEIETSLETFLLVKNDQLEYNISIFCKTIGLDEYEMDFDYSYNDRMVLLRKFIPSKPVVDLVLYDCDFNSIINLNDNRIHNVMMVYNCLTKKELAIIINAMINDTNFYILGIKHDKTSMNGYLIKIYHSNYCKNINKEFHNIIVNTYNSIK